MPRHNKMTMWSPQWRSVDRDLSDMGTRYSIVAPKNFHNQWKSHFDFFSSTKPSFIGGDWVRLSDTTGVGGVTIERWLSTSDTAEVVVESMDDGPKFRMADHGSIVLSEALADGSYRLSIPLRDADEGWSGIEDVDDPTADEPESEE